MADEKKLNVDMEEYSIPEEGGAAGEYSEQMAPIIDSPIRKSGRGKKLLVPVILIVAILVFYQILSWYSHRTGQKGIQEEQEVARKTQQSMVVQPPKAAEPVAVVQPPLAGAEVPPVATTTTVTPEQDVQSKLNILANRTELNTQQLEKLQNGLLKSQAALVALNSTLVDLTSSVDEITKQVQKLSVPKAKPKPAKRVVKQGPPRAIYHVKAIVPGLAWLESSKGGTVAVRVGDKLNGYGMVQVISPQQGMVITSNGSAIQYGVNDF